MRIYFFRHARPLLSSSAALSFDSYNIWSQYYNYAPVSYISCRAVSMKNHLPQQNKCFTSSLSRTIDTAYNIGLSNIESLSLFDEIDLPTFRIPVIKLTPKRWGVLFRLLFMVLPSNIFHRHILARVHQAVFFLEEQAAVNSDIIIVGHGLFNQAVQKELIKRGWITEDGLSRKYLSCCFYYKV